MNFFTVSASPHIRTRESTSRIMLDVVIALIPAGIASIWFFWSKNALDYFTGHNSCSTDRTVNSKADEKAGYNRRLQRSGHRNFAGI